MNEQSSDQPPVSGAGGLSRAEAARDGAMMVPTAQILRQLLAKERDGLFSDAIVARCGAMIGSLARQLLQALARETGQSDIAGFVEPRAEALGQALSAQGDLLEHCHAAAVEAMLADKLYESAGIDPVTGPLLKSLLAAEDADIAGAAMHVLAAQARFMHTSRRMELSLHELPGEVFHRALGTFAAHFSADGDGAVAVTTKLGSHYDEGAGRVPQLARLIMVLSDDKGATARLADAGLAIFATALGTEAGQGREQAILALGESDPWRLAVMMRAADMAPAAMAETLAILHPTAELDQQLAQLEPLVAASLLGGMQPPLEA